MDFDFVQHCSHIVRGIVLELLKVGEFLDGSTATVDVVVFGQLPGQNLQAHHRLLKVKSSPHLQMLDVSAIS